MRKLFTLFSAMLLVSKTFAQTTLVEWNFPGASADAVADWGITLNTTKTITATGTGAVNFPATGATTNSASAGNWDGGSGTKYWMVEVNTTGYNSITLASKQRSTGTGPRDFILEYSIGAPGSWVAVPAGNVTVADNYTTGVFTNIPLPAACDNQASVFIRWVMSSNTSTSGGTVAGTGNSNIDDIRIRGFLIAGASLPGYYYRSVQSGMWDDASTWETSADNLTWQPASLIPTDAANTIIIQSTHVVTINNAASANKLTVNTGAALIHNTGVVFSLFDGAGTDMTIFGSYTINGTMPSGTSSIRVEPNGSVFAETNAAPNASDDFAYSTRVTFADQSYFYWSAGIFDSNNITYFPNSGTNDHPRFVINSSTGIVGAGLQTIINGYLDVRANITFQNSGPKIFRDGILTSAGATLTQLSTSGRFELNGASPNIGGAGTINLNTEGLLIAAGSQASLVSNQLINNSNVTINGDLFAYEYQLTGSTNINLAGKLYTQHANGISTAGTLATTGTVALGAGSTIVYDRLTSMLTDQQFTSRTDYANVQITGGSKKVLNGPATMSGNLTLSNGLVVTTATNLLTIAATGASSTGSSISFVTGPLRKIGNAAFVFPVGKQVGAINHFRTISISAPDNSGDEFTAEFIRGNARLLGAGLITATGLQRVSQCEYWTLDHVNSGAATAVDVTIGWTAQSPCNASYVSELPTLVIAHFNGASWDSYGGAGSATGAISPGSGTITWNGVNAFSPFALGTTSVALNPLPFDVSGFSVRARNSEVVIDWQGINNDEKEKYVIERSRDGVNFEQLRKVQAKVALNYVAYTEVDQHPLKGWNYYRLRVVDQQGREKISHIIKIWFEVKELIRISPNPASEKIVINLSEPSSISEIELVNISGQVIKRVNNIQFTAELNISHLQAGVYYLRILGKYGLTLKSFVIN